jgi:lysophospholipase L1-like esterase
MLLVPIVIDMVEDFVETKTLVIDPVWSIVAVFGVALLTGVEVADSRVTNLFVGARPRPRNVQALLAFGRRIRQTYKILAILVLNTLLIAAALELASRALTDLRDVARSATPSAPDPREKSSYYLGQTWAPQYWQEFKLSRKVQYLSYVVWRRAPFTGATINIDDGGIRRTPGAVCGVGSFKVFVFGGSPIWGTGAPDWGTIPAYLQAALATRESRPVCVVNFGESAYVSTQGVITLLTRLQAGDVPDLTLFYDGPNDVYAAFQSGRPTVHENVGSIARIFEHRGEAESTPLSEWLDRSALVRVATSLVNSLAQPPPPTLRTYETMGIDRTALTEAVVRTYLDNYNVVDALAHKYGFKYAFFWAAHISAGQKHLTAEEEALKREVDPSLAKLYAAVYHTMESRMPQYANLHSLSSIFDGHDALIWIDDAHVTPVGNELLADAMLRAVGRRKH